MAQKIALHAGALKTKKTGHPLRNTASTSLRATDLLKFIKSLSYEPQIVNCGTWIED